VCEAEAEEEEGKEEKEELSLFVRRPDGVIGEHTKVEEAGQHCDTATTLCLNSDKCTLHNILSLRCACKASRPGPAPTPAPHGQVGKPALRPPSPNL
jgi:hypothetical protein